MNLGSFSHSGLSFVMFAHRATCLLAWLHGRVMLLFVTLDYCTEATTDLVLGP